MTELLSGIASLISAIAAIGAVLMSLRNGRKIQEVHISINSRMDQLLQARGEASMAAGVVQGRSETQPTEDPVKVEITKIPPMPKA